MPSCTHDYSPSNQYFVTSAPRAQNLSKAERKHKEEEEEEMFAEENRRAGELFRAKYGLYDASKNKQTSAAEKEEKEADKLRKDLQKQFEAIWRAFKQSGHPLNENKDLMEKLRHDVEKLYQPSKHKEFEQKQAAARVLQNTTKPMPSKKKDPDPFALR
jgi:hypothetical protein